MSTGRSRQTVMLRHANQGHTLIARTDFVYRALILAAIVTAYCVALTLLTAPGFASFDTSYQWWMARHSAVNTLWPPFYIAMFRCFDALSPTVYAPTIGYALNMLVFTCASSLIALFSARSFAGVLVVFFSLAANPVTWLLLPHVWSDVTLVSILIAAVASLRLAGMFHATAVVRRALLLFSIASLFVATGVRHNAILAVAPLLLAWVIVAMSPTASESSVPSWRAALRATGMAALAVIGFGTVHHFLGRSLATERSDTWAITAIWDLQALSVATQRNLVPPSIAPDATLEDLHSSFDPVNAVTMYSLSRAHWANASTGLTAEQSSALATAWWRAVHDTPSAYLIHRARVLTAMLGVNFRGADETPRNAVSTRIEPVQTAFRDNPVRRFWSPSRTELWTRWSVRLSNTLVGSPFATLLASFLAIAFSMLRRSRPLLPLRRSSSMSGHTVGAKKPRPIAEPARRNAKILAITVAASAALYAVGLFIAAPTADMRYIFWPVIASVLSAVFAYGVRAPVPKDYRPAASTSSANPA